MSFFPTKNKKTAATSLYRINTQMHLPTHRHHRLHHAQTPPKHGLIVHFSALLYSNNRNHNNNNNKPRKSWIKKGISLLRRLTGVESMSPSERGKRKREIGREMVVACECLYGSVDQEIRRSGRFGWGGSFVDVDVEVEIEELEVEVGFEGEVGEEWTSVGEVEWIMEDWARRKKRRENRRGNRKTHLETVDVSDCPTHDEEFLEGIEEEKDAREEIIEEWFRRRGYCSLSPRLSEGKGMGSSRDARGDGKIFSSLSSSAAYLLQSSSSNGSEEMSEYYDEDEEEKEAREQEDEMG